MENESKKTECEPKVSDLVQLEEDIQRLRTQSYDLVPFSREVFNIVKDGSDSPSEPNECNKEVAEPMNRYQTASNKITDIKENMNIVTSRLNEIKELVK